MGGLHYEGLCDMLEIGESYYMAKKQKKNKKWAYWLLVLVLFVVVAVIVYLVWNAYFKEEDEGKSSGVTTEVTEMTEIEKKEATQNQEEAEVMEKPKVIQYDGDDPNSSDELSGVITYAGVDGDYLMVRVNIDQYLEDGECKLSLISGGSVIHEEVTDIGSGASTASCNGFNVPLSIAGGGKIDIVVDVMSGEKVGIIQGEVEL